MIEASLELEQVNCYHPHMDLSSGYEAVAIHFPARRGGAASIGIGANVVRKWARKPPIGSCVHRSRLWARLPHHGCLGRGRTARFRTIDAAPSFLAAFQRGLPGVPILCEAVQDSRMFRSDLLRRISLGLIFLLKPDDQRHLIQRFAEILAPGGRLLFTSPAEPAVWMDAMTDLESTSLGAGWFLTGGGYELRR